VVATNDSESDFMPMTFSVTNARAIAGKDLFALVDVELQITDVCFAILGVQARNALDCPATTTMRGRSS
jgi:hypothetical protein